MKFKSACLFFLVCFSFSLLAQQVTPLPHAHAHNDYDQKIPLHDALAHGFTSVEADILNVRGRLYIGHDFPTEKNPALPTLRGAYLEPLYKIYRENDCEIFPGYEGPFYLWIDIKNRPLYSYRKLNKVLLPFKEMLSHYDRGIFVPGKVTIIISGERPIKKILRDRNRLVVLDGRMEDMEFNYLSKLMPFVSQNMKDVCRTNRAGILSKNEFNKLKKFVNKVHGQNRKVRLWATPEKTELWTQLLEAKVDLINTDRLQQLQDFLKLQPSPQQNVLLKDVEKGKL